MPSADETQFLGAGAESLEEARTPTIGVSSMGETHHGDTQFGNAEEVAVHAPESLGHSTSGLDGSAPSSSSAVGRSLPTFVSRPRARRRAGVQRAILVSLVVAACVAGGGLAWLLASKEDSAPRAGSSGSSEKPPVSHDARFESFLSVDVVDAEEKALAGGRVRLGRHVTLTDGEHPVVLPAQGPRVELHAECPEGMRGGPLVRSFNARLLPNEHALRVRLVCQARQRAVDFSFRSGQCEVALQLSTGERMQTAGGEAKGVLQLDTETSAPLRVMAQVKEPACRFRTPAGPKRTLSRVVDWNEQSQIVVEMETEKVAPHARVRPRSPQVARPYRL